MARLRAELGLSQTAVADRVNAANGAGLTRWDISRYERGERIPDLHLPAVATALEADLRQLEHACEATRRDRRGLDSHPPVATPDEDAVDMRRRQLLQAGLIGLVAGSPNDLVRLAVDSALGEAGDNDADDWELVCADHAHSIMTRPPDDVHDALLADLATMSHQISRRGPHAALYHATAQMAALCGNVLTRMGRYDDARGWWSTSRHAADASGDRALSAWTRGVEAAFGLYAPRPLRSVLSLAEAARRHAGARPSLGQLCALGAHAQALATLGRKAEARLALNDLTDAVERTGDVDGYGWTRDSLAYVTSWVHAYSSDPDEGAEARHEVMMGSGSYQNIANARLHEAIAIARAGGYRHAVHQAAEVLAGVAPPYRTRMITRTAARVVEVVPLVSRVAAGQHELEELMSGDIS